MVITRREVPDVLAKFDIEHVVQSQMGLIWASSAVHQSNTFAYMCPARGG